jgi:hypothetical protein
MCTKLGCLPGPGGLLDQDAYYVYMMQCVIEAQAELEQKEEAGRRQSRGNGH